MMDFLLMSAIAWLLCCNASVLADEFPPVYNSELVAGVQPLAPDVAASSFTSLPHGVRVDIFAAEPDVQNPIAMAWDSSGRLWVAENYTYAERSQRFDLGLRDRVVVFSDDDGDGVHDQRKVFTDQVQMLTSIEVGLGYVWLLCPPMLLRIPDRNFDAVPDGSAEVVLDGFDVAAENYHNFANGLRWGPDGWLYGRCGGSCPGRVGSPGTPPEDRIPLEGGIWRYHVQRGVFESLCHGTTNPWGHDWNEWGECFFVNTVNGHLWHLIPGAHFDRPFTLDPNPYVYELLDMHADHWHFDTKGQWFQSRDGSADIFGGGHAHVGMMIYLGNQWPADYRGKLFTWNFHGRRANQELLERSGSGYVARHCQDILQSGDKFFRGMELTYGPDGSVLAIDWSDTGECHEVTGVHRTSGRIFRFSATREQAGELSSVHRPSGEIDQPPSQSGSESQSEVGARLPKDLRGLSSCQLVELHRESNEWLVRQARLILAERALEELETSLAARGNDLQQAAEKLKEQLQGSDDRLAYQSLMTLASMLALSDRELDCALSHSNEHLRTWGIRLLLNKHPLDSVFGECKQRLELPDFRLRQLIRMAQSDPSSIVRLALASALQRLPLESRINLAGALMARSEDASDHNLPLMVWYGLIPVVEQFPLESAELAVASTWPKTQHLLARRIASLKEQAPQGLERLLEGCATTSPTVRLNLLQGIANGLKGWRRTAQPANWPKVLSVLENEAQEPSILQEQKAIVQNLSVLFGEGLVLEQIKTMVLDPKAEISLRRSALENLVASRSEGSEQIYLALLKDSRLNAVALSGLAVSANPEIATALIKHYFHFRSPDRPAVIALLSTRVEWADQLLTAFEKGSIPKDHLTANDVRQLASLNNPEILHKLETLWGKVRTTPDEKRRKMEEIKKLVAGAEVALENLQRGRKLFDRHCAMCHRLFGNGQKIGPDLTGGNRHEIDYLVENIVDPSAVVSKDYRNSIIVTVDGRTLTGLVVSQSEKTVELQTPTERLTLLVSEIEQISPTSQSPMPEGLVDALSRQEIIDLMAYLRHPTQVALREE